MNDNTNKKKHIFFIILILFLTVALSAGMLIYACNKAGIIQLFGAYTVKYHSTSGSTIKTCRVNEGFAKPPKKIHIPQNTVFLRWDKDILNISDNTDIYPATRDIKNEANVIYMNAKYVESGKEFQTDLLLGGAVDFSDLTFVIQYDKKCLQYTGEKDLNKHISIKNDTDNAILSVKITANENIKEGGVLAKLGFKAVGRKFNYTELKLKIDSIEKNLNNNGKVGTECTMYNGKIYIY